MKINEVLATAQAKTLELSMKKAVELALKECNNYVWNMDYNPVWRGSNQRRSICIASTSRLLRTSTDNSNNINFLTDLYSPESFAKRRSSLICTTDVDFAADYGTTIFAVVPTDKAKVCFSKVPDFIQSEVDFFGKENCDLDDVDMMLSKINLISTKESIKEVAARLKDRDSATMKAIERFRPKDEQLDDFEGYLAKVFSPESLGIKGGDSRHISEVTFWKNNRECWIQGEALMIPMSEVSEFKKLAGIELRHQSSPSGDDGDSAESFY